jgi:VWFA-related protein
MNERAVGGSVRHSWQPKWIFLLLFVIAFAADGLTQQTGQSVGGGGGQGPGQNQSQSQSQNQDPFHTKTQPAIRVTSKMVQLSVIVHDKDGNPISGLKKEDFKLYDQGQQQKIAFFSEQSNILRTQTATTRDLPNTQHAYTNRETQDASHSGSVTAILLDKLNTWAWDMDTKLHQGTPLMNSMPIAMTEVTKFLRQVQPEDRVALYGLSDKLYSLRDFTNDADLLLRAMGVESADGDRKAAEAWVQALGPRRDILDDEYGALEIRAVETVAAFRSIAKHLSGVPGRKSLIWVTAGFPGHGASGREGTRSFESEIVSAIRALADANIAVYPVDSRGLIGPNMIYHLQGSLAPRRAEFNTMNNIADGTGGRALYNTNDIAGSIRKSIDDSRISYLLGYYPSNEQWDGGFRELKVKVSRPGVEVRARNGYYAVPDITVTAAQREAQLDDAIRSSLDSSELGLEVTVDPVETANPHQLKVRTKLDPTQLHMAENAGVWTDKLDVAWAEYDATGKSLGTVTQSISVKLSKERREVIAQEGIVFSETVDVRDGAVEARMAVRDGGSGAIGSVNIPLTRMFAAGAAPQSPKK